MLLDQTIHDLTAALREQGPATARSSTSLADRLGAIRDVLLAEPVHARDGWLDARARRTDRDRRRLVARLGALGARLHERTEVSPPTAEVRRLLTDLEHYRQRLHDLTFDAVGLELGGSE
ncbi:MAG: hypothetical protein ACRDPH_04485 [Marmoricola sp.]